MCVLTNHLGRCACAGEKQEKIISCRQEWRGKILATAKRNRKINSYARWKYLNTQTNSHSSLFFSFFSLSLSLPRVSLNGVFWIGRQQIKIWPFIVKNKKQCNLVNPFQGLLGLSISVFRQPMKRLASLKGPKFWPFIVKIAVKAVLYWDPFTKRAWVKRSEWNADSLLTYQHQAAYEHCEENEPLKISVLHEHARAPSKQQPAAAPDVLTTCAARQRRNTAFWIAILHFSIPWRLLTFWVWSRGGHNADWNENNEKLYTYIALIQKALITMN